jgi:hypothetical protein
MAIFHPPSLRPFCHILDVLNKNDAKKLIPIKNKADQNEQFSKNS